MERALGCVCGPCAQFTGRKDRFHRFLPFSYRSSKLTELNLVNNGAVFRLPIFAALLAFLCLVTIGQATTPAELAWSKYADAGYQLDDRFGGVTYDASGNTYFASVTPSLTDNVNYLTVNKLDSFGKTVWTYSTFFFGGISAKALITDGSNNVYVTGEFLPGAYLLKLSSTGVFQWVKTYRDAGSFECEGEALGIEPSTGDIVVGLTDFNLGPANVGLTILNYSQTGTLVSHNTYSQDLPTTFRFTSGGKLLVCGNQANGTGPFWDFFSTSGTRITGETATNTTGLISDTFHFVVGSDLGDEAIVLKEKVEVQSNNILLSDNYVAREFAFSGALIWTSPVIDGVPYAAQGYDSSKTALADSTGVHFIDHSGTVSWSQSIGLLYDISVDGNGGVATISRTGTSPDFGLLVQHYAINGVLDWSKGFGPSNGRPLSSLHSSYSGNMLRLAGTILNGTSGQDILLLNYVQGLAVSALSVTPNSNVGGGNATLKVTLDGLAPQGNVAVKLASSDSVVLPVLSVLLVLSGQSTASMPVTIQPVDSAETVRIDAVLNGAQRSALVTLRPSPDHASAKPTAQSTTPASESPEQVEASDRRIKGGTPLLVAAPGNLPGVRGSNSSIRK